MPHTNLGFDGFNKLSFEKMINFESYSRWLFCELKKIQNYNYLIMIGKLTNLNNQIDKSFISILQTSKRWMSINFLYTKQCLLWTNTHICTSKRWMSTLTFYMLSNALCELALIFVPTREGQYFKMEILPTFIPTRYGQYFRNKILRRNII